MATAYFANLANWRYRRDNIAADTKPVAATLLPGGIGYRVPASHRPNSPDFIEIAAIPIHAHRKLAVRALLTPLKASILDDDKRTCQVCRDDYRADNPQEQLNDREVPVSLHCGHDFGELCAIEWLSRHGTCPHPWCDSTYFLSNRFIASTIKNERKIDLGRISQAVKYRNFTTSYWQRERAGYISKLRAKGALSGEALRDAWISATRRNPWADNALRFVEKNTIPDIPPNPAARFICYQITERPEFLSEPRFGAADYFTRKEQQRGYLSFGELAWLLQRDLDI